MTFDCLIGILVPVRVKKGAVMSGSILKISEAASIALHSMIELAKSKDKLISVKDIAAKLDVSANHLSKVLQRLTKSGYIVSIKGFNGGFKLAVKPENLTFLEIYELFDGKLKDTNCILARKECAEKCIFGGLVASITDQVRDKFENTKLSDFIK